MSPQEEVEADQEKERIVVILQAIQEQQFRSN